MIYAIILLVISIFIDIKKACSHENILHISHIVRVYDGDTVYVNIKGLPDIFGKNIGVRLSGIDTPEKRLPRNLPEKERVCLKRMAKKATNDLKFFLFNGKKLDIINIHRDKYFRINGDILVDGKSASEYMLNYSYAKPYDGGTKEKWECDE